VVYNGPGIRSLNSGNLTVESVKSVTKRSKVGMKLKDTGVLSVTLLRLGWVTGQEQWSDLEVA